MKDGTIYIYSGTKVFALIPLSKNYDVDDHRNKIGKDSNKNLNDTSINWLLSSVIKYDLRIDGSYVVILKKYGELQMLRHSKNYGFQETAEATWHIEDMMRFKSVILNNMSTACISLYLFHNH
jgi:hypothetical protein